MPGAVPVAPNVDLRDGLYIEIWNARHRQLEARVAWARSARSANIDTIRAETSATRALDVLLDRLLLRRRATQ